MATTYYIFQKNKVVSKISNAMPLQFTKTEKVTICAGITPLTAGNSKDGQDITVIELPKDFDLPGVTGFEPDPS